MSGADFWAEREAAKEDALKMAANLTAGERGYLVRSVANALSDEVRHDQTPQRRFERSFLSLDAPDENGNLRECSCGDRELRRMIRELDRPYWEHVRELRFWNALYQLRKHPELQTTLRAIRTFRVRQKIISALQIKGEVYEKRFQRVRKILEISS